MASYTFEPIEVEAVEGLAPAKVNLTNNIARPVECLEIYLKGDLYTAPDVRIVNADSLIQFEGKIYSPVPFVRDPISVSSSNSVDGYRIGIDNANKGITRMILENRFSGGRIVLRKVFRPTPSRLSSVVLFDGKIQSIEVSQVTVSLVAASILEAFNQEMPRRLFQTRCNYRFGGEWCGVDATSVKRNHYGSAMRGSTTQRIIDPTLIGFEDNYWDAGFVVMMEGPDLEIARPVARFDSEFGKLVLRFPFPNSPVGYRYRVRQGCKKTKADCNDRHNNLRNYGAFAEVPPKPDLR